MSDPLLSKQVFDLQSRIGAMLNTQYKMSENEQVIFLSHVARIACAVHKMEVALHDQDINNFQLDQVMRRPKITYPANDVGGQHHE